MKAIFNIEKNIRNSHSINALCALRKLHSLGILLCALLFGSLQVWGTETAFSWAGSSTADAGTTDYVVTDSPITLTFSQGTHANNAPRTNKEGSVRMYTGNTLTIASSSGNITRVVFTPTSSTYDATHLTYGGDWLTSDDWTLASASASVTLSATANARFTAITVYSGSSTYTVTIAKNQASWGTVDKNSVTGVANNTSISASSNVLTVGATTVTATPHAQDADYNYEFSSWGGIPASGKVTANVTVTANFTRTLRPLTNYRTSCCTPIGTISGDVTCSSHTSTTATLGWTMASTTGLATNGIIIKVYRESDDALVYTSSALSKDATSHTTSATLSPCTSYYATLTTVSSGSTYCDGVEQGISDPFTTSGTYTYTINKDGVSLKGGETEAADNCEDFLAEYVANDGYTLPATITVTGASNYTWEDGILGIDKEDVTGNVTVDIEGVAPWIYSGEDNSWTNTAMTLSTGGTYFYIQSSRNNHQFKIRKGSDWYGDNYLKPGFAMTNITALYDYSEGECDDCNCYCTYNNGSYYIIVFLGSTFLNNASTPVICASTTLPDDSPSGLAETKKIYLTPNSSWLGSSAKFAVNYYGHGTAGWSAYMTQSPCDEDVWEVDIPKLYSDIIIVRLDPSKSKGWDAKWNQTGDLRIPAGKNRLTLPASGTYEWNGATETWSAYTPDTYTISFDKGTGTSGSMSSLSSIACDANQALTANSFSKTGYSFSHWTANVAVKVGGATVAIGDPIADEATIQNITSDITLTAQWTANKYDVTLKPNSGSGSDQTVQATYGSAMPLTVKTAGTAIVVPTRTGYDFNGYWDDASTGTQYYTYTGSPKALGSARNWDKTAATNLFAHWTAKQTTVSFNQNGGTGGQTTSKTATYDQAMPTPITVPTREGHTFGGYYESTGGTGAQYYTNAGASAKNWDKTDATWTLYAKWTVNNYTLTWDWNGGSTSSTTHTAAGSVAYGTTLVYPADGTMSKTGYTFTGWSSTPATMPASSTTITAQWSVNSYNVAVQTVSYVTIKATPSGGSAITEGNNANVAYNTTITLNYSSKDSRYTWGGWRVTKAGDPSVVVCNSTANNATFPMPDYAITVTAYLYSDAIAWCDPDVTITGDVHLTSTKDVYVNTTSGAGNLLNVASTDLGSATSMDIAYLNADAADAEVDKAASAFRLYASDASAAIDASSSSVDISASRTFDTDYSMRYTPTAYSQYNNYKLQLTFKKGDKVLKTVKKPIYGRGLPEEFVIAVKKGDIWVALPNDLATTSAQPAIVPLPITVDNTTTPTEAVYTPINTVYKARNRGNDSHISTIRFTTTGSNYLQVSGSDGTYNMWLSTTNSANVQDWQLKSSDNSAYELTIPSTSTTKKMGIYNNTYMGYHGSPNNADIYILPITNTYTDIPATVHEWGEHGAILEADMTGVASATMHVADGSAAAATLTPVNAASLTEGKYVRIYKSDMTVGAVANENKQLYVHWKNAGGDEIGVSQVTIPCVIAADNDMYSIATTKKAWGDKSEVHILPGVTLDANAGSFSGDGALSVSHMEVYPGATLKVSTGTFNATTLRLRNGWTRAGDKQYNSARVYIASSAALTKTTASMDYDIYEQSDGKHYYPLAVPFATAVNTIDYIDPTLAAASTYNKHFVIKGYDGANRAINGEDSNNNWDVVAEDATLQPGIGYIMTAVAVKGSAIIRVPLTFNNGWTSDGEKATYDAVTKNVVAVTAYSGAKASENQRHKGWNMLGVPFMSCYGNVDDIYSGGGAATLINGEIVIVSKSDPYEYINTEVPYVSVPSHDFAEYVQTDIEDAKLLPGWSFFVQVNTDGNLTFNVSNREPDEDNPIYAPRHRKAEEVVRTGIILSRGETSDKTTILVSDKYSSEYEVGADLEKMFGSGYTLATYSLSNGTRLAYNALSQTDAQQLIPIGYRAPEDGEYTFSLNPRYAENSAFEHVYLIDYQTGDITDLMASSYTFSTVRTQEDTRFTINVVPRKLTTTDIEGGAATESRTQKILLNDKLYIIRGGHMYDATGKRVSEINK